MQSLRVRRVRLCSFQAAIWTPRYHHSKRGIGLDADRWVERLWAAGDCEETRDIMKPAGIEVAALGALICLGTPGQGAADLPKQPVPAIVREITAAAGFGDADLARVWSGEIVSRSISEHSEKELAVAVIMRLRESHRDFYERVRNGQLFEIDRTVIHAEEIPSTSSGSPAFARLRLDAGELRRLGTAAAGVEFNLSEPEIEGLRQAAEAGDQAVLGAYRQVLAERLRAYREAGIDGVASYARGGRGEARPAEDLRLAISTVAGVAERCPSFYGSFAEFPAGRDPNVSHQLFWALQRIQNRPTAILSHWALQLHEQFAVFGERQFYVGQGYDALQGMIGAFSIAEGESLVFYENRTTTGRVTGLFGSVARAIGHMMMIREVTAFFRDIRESTAAGSELQ